MSTKRLPLEPDKYYHIYNHGNANDDLFKEEKNYKYFLTRFYHYANSVSETFAYCLMPNHYHFLIKIKTESELKKGFLKKYPKKNLQSIEELTTFTSNQFSNFFNAYAKAFNKMYNRRGALFIDAFGRKEVKDRDYLINLVHYIHYNPVHHGFVNKIEDWNFSSYNFIISGNEPNIKWKEVINWFNDLDNFIFCHQQKPTDL
ncbi:MAG: hypothetical protein K8R37_02175 [Bacteroidales bacterium]|nr:hypothetical protein [Bacteroidales bacterium]